MRVNTSAGTVVDRVHLHGTALEPRTARLRLEHTLAGADLRPTGLPAAAWLYVRSLADPLPRAIALSVPQRSPVWERACRAALERAFASAVRPARAHVPAGAEAVWFADQAELLACLARDALDGVAWTRWWWRRLRADAPPGEDFVIRSWLAGPQHVPAALDLLVSGGDSTAVRFAGSLSADVSRSLTERVSRAFRADRLSTVVCSPDHAVPEPALALDSGPAPVTPPWHQLVPEGSGAAELPVQSELLLGVALALRRAPPLARSNAFAARVQRWLRAPPRAVATRARPGRPAAVRADPPRVAERSDRRSLQDRHVEASASTIALQTAPRTGHGGSADPGPPPRQASIGQPHESPTTELRKPPPPSDSGAAPRSRPPLRQGHEPAQAAPSAQVLPPAPCGGSARDRSVPRSVLAASAESERSSIAAIVPDLRTRRLVANRRAPTAAGPAPALIAQAGPLAIETELGGTFYLLNLAIFLGLYGDFTTPLGPGIALDPWDYLALMGRALAGPRFRRDPIWTMLARLAGRDPRISPGRGFRPPRAWRTPRAWLEPFDPARGWRWSAAGGTLRILHPAGFPAVAVPRSDARAADQLSRELVHLAASRPTPPQRTALRPEPKPPLARWTSRTAAYAQARLRLALGAAAEASLVDLMLSAHARVLITHTHVEVVLRLRELPLAVRFAGLDRTPGWLPAAGRFVSIEFE